MQIYLPGNVNITCLRLPQKQTFVEFYWNENSIVQETILVQLLKNFKNYK